MEGNKKSLSRNEEGIKESEDRLVLPISFFDSKVNRSKLKEVVKNIRPFNLSFSIIF